MRSLFVILPLVTLGWLASINTVRAQVSSDGSLSTTVSSPDGSNFTIENGNRAGGNLFHSFSQFSVPTNGSAVFQNPVDVQNIISRVTGGSISNIDGLIRANGSANLFLLNPAGIAFGPNARLNIGGSFFATTANSLLFGDGVEFSATNLATPPVLTVNIPIGLRFRDNPGRIQVQGNGQGIRQTFDLIDTTDALRVQPDKTLALVGSDLSLEGATLKTAGGRIELGSVAGEGLVSLTSINKGFSLGYDAAPKLGNIQLSQQAVVDASGEGSGDVQITGKRVTLTNGSRIEASTLGSQSGGSFVVNASELVEVIGTSSDGQIASTLAAFVYPGVTGSGAELTINTGVLLVRDGGTIGTSTFGSGKAGNVSINASEAVQVIGVRADGPSLLAARTRRGATGDGGNLIINTGTLLLQDGAQVSATTFGAGKAGNLTVNATKGVQLLGTTADGQFGSGLYAQADQGSTGSGGNLTINTTKLLIQNGAEASAGTFGKGNGGNLTINATEGVQVIGVGINNLYSSDISVAANRGSTGSAGSLTINTPELVVREGAYVSASTTGSGKGGNITVNAPKRVQVIGTNATGEFFSSLSTSAISTSANRGLTGAAGDLTINTGDLIVGDGAEVSAGTSSSGKGGNLIVNASRSVQVRGTDLLGFPSALATQATRGSTGSAGDITINTHIFQVTDGAGVIVRSRGQGNAGNLNVNADSIRLDNKAFLTADTGSVNTDPNKEQATINLRSQDLILRRNSKITTNANGSDVIGGNINIKTGVLTALENSDISANSADFRGGRVRINAKGIFGTQFRDTPTPESDITTTGANPDLSGNVEIITSDVDPSQGLLELPDNITDPSSQIAQNPCQKGAGSSFTVNGRGGLPSSPDDGFSSDNVRIDLVNPSTISSSSQSSTINQATAKPTAKKIIPAQGWIFNDKGEVVLTAYDPTTTNPQRTSKPTAACPAF